FAAGCTGPAEAHPLTGRAACSIRSFRSGSPGVRGPLCDNPPQVMCSVLREATFAPDLPTTSLGFEYFVEGRRERRGADKQVKRGRTEPHANGARSIGIARGTSLSGSNERPWSSSI